MFWNYLIVAARNLRRHKLYSAINISGLAIGIACTVLISLYVRHEMTYDTFHRDADRIYRIYTIGKAPSGERPGPAAPNALARVLLNDYPGLGEVVRFFVFESWIAHGEDTFKEEVVFADPNVFDVFAFPFVKGDPGTALRNKHSMVITEDLARKYFGDGDPVGQVLTFNSRSDFTVTGVLRAIPSNSNFQFGILIPFSSFADFIDVDQERVWHSVGTHTFVKLSEGFSPAELEGQLPLVVDKYAPGFIKKRIRLDLQPLADIHLTLGMGSGGAPPVSVGYLYVLATVAFFVLLIACINFMNLSTARYTERTTEIGMRKVLGARRMQLIGQFLGESVFFSLLALMIGIALVELSLPEFNNLTGKRLALDYGHSALRVFGLIGFGVFVGLSSGVYPAFFLSRHRPADALKGQRRRGGSSVTLRQALVTAQFSIAVLLIVCEAVILHQLRYMSMHDVGFDPGGLIAIPVRVEDIPDPVSRMEA